MKASTTSQLLIMMFLQFFVWGIWFVTMGTFLAKIGTSDTQISSAYATQSIGAIIAPFIIGLIADRYFAAQKVLGTLHCIGGGLLWFASTSESFNYFYPHIFLYMILYMPTLALVNSVAFRQMIDPSKDFPRIRVSGTVGWIVAGLFIGWMGWEESNTLQNTFKAGSICSISLGLFSFWLPDTPPVRGKQVSIAKILGLDALQILKDRSFLIFFISSILICIPLAFYYQFTNLFLNEAGMSKAASKMTIGQMSEVLFMLSLPFFFKRFGLKYTLIFGMLAWAIRYFLFAFGDVGTGVWMLLLGIALHGICYDFFFVAGQIYTDQKSGEANKSAAQGLITLATYGVGMFVGFYFAGIITEYFITDTGHNWKSIWQIPAIFAFLVMLLFTIFFKDNIKIKT